MPSLLSSKAKEVETQAPRKSQPRQQRVRAVSLMHRGAQKRLPKGLRVAAQMGTEKLGWVGTEVGKADSAHEVALLLLRGASRKHLFLHFWVEGVGGWLTSIAGQGSGAESRVSIWPWASVHKLVQAVVIHRWTLAFSSAINQSQKVPNRPGMQHSPPESPTVTRYTARPSDVFIRKTGKPSHETEYKQSNSNHKAVHT